jgi:hypothetical protein
MQEPAPADFCSRYFQYQDLLYCGQTWQLHQPDNMPLHPQSWLDLAALANTLLDPITEHFGKPVLTYGFAGPQLQKLIKQKSRPQIAPRLDQHAASELNRNGKPICPRAGAAVDLYVTGLSSWQLALWVAQHLPFDRMYLYGANRPIHLSFNQEPKRQITLLRELESDQLIPQRLSQERLMQMSLEVTNGC